MDATKLSHSANVIDKVIGNYPTGKTLALTAPGDYYEWVIPLVCVDESMSVFCGDVLIARDNSIYPATRVILNMGKPYNLRQCRCDNLVVSTVDTCHLCHFSHDAKRYYGIKWIASAHPSIIRFNIMYNYFDPVLITYKFSGDIINQEIHDSIVNVNWDGTLKE